jgi:catechol 2,3-dioxygenase-like lactoylglutathione lyase family enzyme
MPVLSHVDVRVRDRARAEKFYDALFAILGGEKTAGKQFTTWSRTIETGLTDGRESYDWFGITEDKAMTPGSTRISFYAPDRATVDRVAAILPGIGATTIEWADGDYGAAYYAVFFLDADGNPLEVCCCEPGESIS